MAAAAAVRRFWGALCALLYPRGACCVACGALRTDDEAGLLCRECREELASPLPPRCPGCGAEGWKTLCTDCSAKLPRDFLVSCAPYAYAGAAGSLVRRLKYDCEREAAEPLADAMSACLPEEPFDALVPAPLNRLRERERGFNQSQVLCEAIGRRTRLPVLDALERVRYTKTQTHLSAEEREKNVANVFRCRENVAGLRVILVDDVRTTGATAKSCVRTLRDAGAERVILLTATIAAHRASRAKG